MITHSLKVTTAIEPRSDAVTRCTDLAIASIDILSNGSCEFQSGQTCTAKHVFHANVINATDAVTYQWTTDVGYEQDDGTHQNYEVWLTNKKKVTMTITCTVTDAINTASYTLQVVSYHELVKDCITAGESGEWRGYTLDVMGSIEIKDGSHTELIHDIKWANDGRFRVQLGDNGDLQLADTDAIDVIYQAIKYVAVWDGGGYEFTNVPLTDALNISYNNGDIYFCFGLNYLPNLVISTDFKELL